LKFNANIKSNDPDAPGFTYEDLPQGDAKEMVLWRPIFDGLVGGMRSSVQSNSAGVGHIVQRGSAMTLRAILLCYKDSFSPVQWSIIITKVILPAITDAIRSDQTEVTKIISSLPAKFQLNAIQQSLDLPPQNDSQQLKDFVSEARSQVGAPIRSFGPSELLVEATFSDLRQGGDGNIGRSIHFDKIDEVEHPFPDSWIATTAGISLGLLTDIMGSVVFMMENEDIRRNIWSAYVDYMQFWIGGKNIDEGKTHGSLCYDGESKIKHSDDNIEDDLSGITQSEDGEEVLWQPCEALIRLSIHEFCRLSTSLSDISTLLTEQSNRYWWDSFVSSLSSFLELSRLIHMDTQTNLIEAKLEELKKHKAGGMKTPYGSAALIDDRDTRDDIDSDVYRVRILKLDWGATLYQPLIYGIDYKDGDESFYLNKFVPRLKINAIRSYALATTIFNHGKLDECFLNFTSPEIAKKLTGSLTETYALANLARNDNDLAHAFSEMKRIEWGSDDLQQVERFLREMKGFPIESQRGGTGTFFLPLEASSAQSLLHFYSQFFYADPDTYEVWDMQTYAEPLLFELMLTILKQFIKSEQNTRTLISKLSWIEGRGCDQVDLYCLSFESVLMLLLDIILQLDDNTFKNHTASLFPLLCDLIEAQSDEIRVRVCKIMKHHVGGSLLRLQQ